MLPALKKFTFLAILQVLLLLISYGQEPDLSKIRTMQKVKSVSAELMDGTVLGDEEEISSPQIFAFYMREGDPVIIEEAVRQKLSKQKLSDARVSTEEVMDMILIGAMEYCAGSVGIVPSALN